METGQASGTAIGAIQTVSAYIKLNANNSVPACPAGGTYTTSSVSSVSPPQVRCSLSTLASAHALP